VTVTFDTNPTNKAQIFDGKSFSKSILDKHVKTYASRHSLKLDVIWVGNNLESEIYVNHKQKIAKEYGIKTSLHHLPNETTTEQLIELIGKLNFNEEVTGFFVQLPVPDHINLVQVLKAIDPNKDIDGLTPTNLGLLWQYQDTIAPATPAGIMTILEDQFETLEGKDVVIVNDSNIVGKPLTAMLLKRHATVTVCHKFTKKLDQYTRRAEVIISAAGVQNLINAEMIKNEAVLIDVATKRLGPHGSSIVGDFADDCREKASFITPVPGGIGPVTVAFLMLNLVRAHELQDNLV